MVNTYKEDEKKTKFSFHNLARMMKFVRPYYKDLLLGFLISVISSILMLVVPKIMVYAIDVSFINHNFMEIILLTFIILGIILLAVFLTKIKRDKLIVVLDKVSHDLKVAIFEKLQSLPNSYYDTKSHGKIYTRASTYPDEATAIMCYVLLEMILDIINLIFVLIFMLSCNIKLSLITISLAIIVVILFIIISPIRRKLQHVLNEKNSNINAYISESINGVKIIQSFNREDKNLKILNDLENKRNLASKKTFYLGNLNWSVTGSFNIIGMALVYYIGLRYFYPTASIGNIVAVDSYSSNFWNPISYLTSSYNEIMDAFTYLERIFELLDEPIIIEEKKNAKDILIKGNIEFKNVSFSYNGKNDVLKNFNLKISAGEKIGLVGTTGSGKSTILSLITRFYDACDGEIFIDEENIKDLKLKTLRSNVCMMLQDNFLFARSVYDNLVLDKKISKEEVYKICKLLDIHNLILSLENGYDTVLLNNGSNLSSGERQLLCIARIMIQNPKILILDEATSNIDLKTEKKVEKAIEILTKNRTTIMVAHRISTIRNCDKIVVIKDHHACEEGTHKELMKKKMEYYNLYMSQTKS